MKRISALAWSGLLAFSAAAQAVPKLDSLSATWFQRGTTNEVTVNGEAFGGVSTVLFTGNGLAGNFSAGTANGVTLEGSAGGITVGQADTGKALTLRVIVAGDAPLGGHELRLAGPNGVSNPLAVNVSDLPELLEQKPNNQPTEAPLLTLPAAVSGIIGSSTEADYFRFKARAGERLIFDVQANRFGSPLDPTLPGRKSPAARMPTGWTPSSNSPRPPMANTRRSSPTCVFRAAAITATAWSRARSRTWISSFPSVASAGPRSNCSSRATISTGRTN